MKSLIQIGCNDGADHVYNFISENPNKYNIYLIDADEEALTICKEKYKDIPNVKFFHYAIVNSDEKEAKMYTVGPAHQHNSLSEKHMTVHGHSKLIEKIVPAIKLEKLIEQEEIIEIEWLFVDTEGYDIEILQGFNIEKYNIENIRFEYIHSDGTLSYGGPLLDQFTTRLSNLGYVWEKDGFDIVAKK